jgi:hypothetical protein
VLEAHERQSDRQAKQDDEGYRSEKEKARTASGMTQSTPPARHRHGGLAPRSRVRLRGVLPRPRPCAPPLVSTASLRSLTALAHHPYTMSQHYRVSIQTRPAMHATGNTASRTPESATAIFPDWESRTKRKTQPGAIRTGIAHRTDRPPLAGDAYTG